MTTRQLSVDDRPDWKGHPETFPDAAELPVEWQGLPVSWESGYRPRPVFIGQRVLPNGEDVFLFGVRFETSKARAAGRRLPQGYFIEYLVLEVRPQGAERHRLFQKRGPIYSSTPTKDDYVFAADLHEEDVERLSRGTSPDWKSEDAQWPTYNSQPMQFVGQFNLIENDVTRTYLTWDKAIFLFWVREEDAERSRFKISTQDIDYQSAEEHYAAE
jgi:hypothetical protein